jgi:outer membrane protein assembly factor BamB
LKEDEVEELRRVKRYRSFSGILVLALSFLVLPGADWPRFRGPDGSGASAETHLPLRWSDQEGLSWKLELPGPGSSSPVVSGGRLFVTCYSGYGVGRGQGEPDQLKRHVVCVEGSSGKLLWDRVIQSKLPEARFEGIGIPNHGYASSTPVADGERVYAFFGKTGVVALDFKGEQVWRADIAPEPATHMFGSGSSPILYKDLLIVPAGPECEAVVAFNRKTGAEAWRTPIKGYGSFWGTPVLAESGEKKELLLNVPGEIWSLNPENGKLRWFAESFPEQAICPSIVVSNGVAYAIGGRQGGSIAVKLGGRGDVTKTHVVWKGTSGSYVTSPVVKDGHLYFTTDKGITYCLKAEDGAKAFEERLQEAGSVYASPVAADGKLYVVTRRSGTFVLEAQPKFRQLAQNRFASDESDFNASPAVSDGRVFLRSNRFLYCIASPKEAAAKE